MVRYILIERKEDTDMDDWDDDDAINRMVFKNKDDLIEELLCTLDMLTNNCYELEVKR